MASAEEQIADLTARLAAAEAQLAELGATPAAPGTGAGAAEPAKAEKPAEKATVDKSALFASIGSIDQSGGKTQGLRHVTKDMKSGSAAAPKPKAVAAPKPKKKKAPAKPVRPPSTSEARSGWTVERYIGENVELSEVKLMQSVYIADCKNATILISSKCKGVVVENCIKTRVIVDKVLSAVEMVRCKSSGIIIRTSCPTVSLDKSESIMVTLSQSSIATQIVSSNISAVNITYPTEDGEDEVEKPIPEQFVSVIKDGAVTTRVSDLYH